jgi:TatD DNase family protein
MKLIDTHTHIYLPEFDTDRDEAVGRALDKGIVRLLLPNIDTRSVGPMLSVADRFKGICIPMIGLHPTSVKEDYMEQLESLESLWSDHKFVAVGEIGIDLYWDKTFIEEQIYCLRRQILFAIEKKVPVAIHSRDSFPEVFSILEEFKGKGLKGVLHAFTGTIEDATRAIGMGFMLGIGGIVTFKNAGLDRIVQEIGPRNLILETDSPYLAPVPYRGKRNESAYLRLINKKLSEIFMITEGEMAEITFDNSIRLFNLEQ